MAAVACTAQWSGTVPVDEHGQPIRHAIIWMDSRGAPYVRRITSGAVRVQGYGVVKLVRWLRTTAGIPAQSGKDPIAHILWLKHEEPETYRRALPVPGTQGLAERLPHRAGGGIIRLDRAALGDRQPPPGPHPL